MIVAQQHNTGVSAISPATALPHRGDTTPNTSGAVKERILPGKRGSLLSSAHQRSFKNNLYHRFPGAELLPRAPRLTEGAGIQSPSLSRLSLPGHGRDNEQRGRAQPHLRSFREVNQASLTGKPPPVQSVAEGGTPLRLRHPLRRSGLRCFSELRIFSSASYHFAQIQVGSLLLKANPIASSPKLSKG